MRKFLAFLSLFIPQSLLSSKYINERVGLLAIDSNDCEHEWDVVAGILNSVELQVQCKNCATYSEVPSPTKEEWEACSTAMENPYPWTDLSRIRLYQNDGKLH